MFFSGSIQHGKCKDCGLEVTRVTSSSILFWIFLVGMAVAVTIKDVRMFFEGAWWYWIVAILGQLVAMVIVVTIWGILSMQFRRIPKKCARCGGEIEPTGGGFYDFSLIPNLDDFMITLIFVSIQFVVLIFL